MAAKCNAIARSGERCGSPALPASAYCFVHDPASAEARREASRKGGRARANTERAKKQMPAGMAADELAGWLAVLFKGVVAGRVEPKVGTAAAVIARCMMEVKGAADLETLRDEVETLRVEIERRGRAA